MATTQATPAPAATTKAINRTVFDLAKFEDVKLTKTITLPNKPANIQEALTAVGGDTEKLLNVIYEGLVADASDTARDQIDGFKVIGEDGEPGELYIGKYADEEKSKLIGNAVLSMAKMFGYDKSLPVAKKNELKDRAMAFLKENPAILASIQFEGAKPAPTA